MFRDVGSNAEAIAYIRTCLEQGNTLARYLLDLPLEEGRVIIPLTVTVNEVTYSNFAVGGVTARNDTEPLLADFISAYLDGENGRYAIFEDTLAQLGDAFLSSSKTQFVAFETEIYYFLSSRESNSKTIISVVRQATSHLFIGVLTSLAAENDLHTEQAITLELLTAIVQHAEHILIGAYDGEGVLIWSRR